MRLRLSVSLRQRRKRRKLSQVQLAELIESSQSRVAKSDWRTIGPSCLLCAIGVYSSMKFIETPIFFKDVRDLLSDEEYRGLQLALLLRPEQGSVIPGSRGLRKIRWRAKGKGRRGGVRVIYYWITSEDTIFMLLLYEKSDQDDLTPTQSKVLMKLVREELE